MKTTDFNEDGGGVIWKNLTETKLEEISWVSV